MSNIVSIAELRAQQQVKHDLERLIDEEEAEKILEALREGQGGYSNEEASAAIKWAQLARLRSIVLNSILEGRINCSFDKEAGEMRVVPMKDEEEDDN